MKTKQMMLIIVGWLAATAALFDVMLELELYWNFFNWSPKWDVKALLYGIGILAILVCVWFLAKATRGRVCHVISALVCLILVGYAVVGVLPAEPLSGGWLGRTMPSPLWFRGSLALLLCLPSVFWLWKTWQHSTYDTAA